VAEERNVFEIQLACELLEFEKLGAFPRDAEGNAWNPPHSAKKVCHALLRGEPAEIEDWRFSRWRRGFRSQPLEVVENVDLTEVPPALDEQAAHEFSRREQARDALGIRSEPALQVRLSGEEGSNGGGPGITGSSYNMPELAAATLATRFAPTDPVIAGANQLEVVDVVEHRNLLQAKLP
jgi:hypothetical protein